MNKSKITALTAIATVMSANAAYADLSLSGAMAGNISSGDANSGLSHGVSTSSIYVSYSSTLDNGMGMSAGFSSTGAGNNFSIGIDTGMGSINFGETHSSAVDKMDGMPAGVNTITSTASLGTYSDGDSAESMGFRYTSPSFNGWTVGLSMGEDSANTASAAGDRTSSMAISGSIAGVSLAGGKVDQIGTLGDDTFMTVGYSVAGVSLGYGNYDSDGNGESTVMGLNTSFAGLSLGFEVEDWDSGSAAADQDQSSFSVGKDLGGMGVTLIYTDKDAGTGVDNQNWTVFYSVGF
jgi:hypothetical protein